MPLRARIYIGCVIALAVVVCGAALLWSPPRISLGFAILLACSVASGALKIRLPGITGTYSLLFLPILAGLSRFGLGAAIVGGIVGVLAQSLIAAKRRPSLVQVLFNGADVVLSIALAFMAYDRMLLWAGSVYQPAIMALVAAVYFATNTCLVSGILSLLEGKPLGEVCQTWYVWSFPYYMIGAALVSFKRDSGLEALIIVLPLAYLVHFYCAATRVERRQQQAGSSAVPPGARMFANSVILGGAAVLVCALLVWRSANPPLFFTALALAATMATWKIRLPGMRGTLAVGFVPILLAALQLGLAETALVGLVIGLVQSLWKPVRRPLTIQVLFSAAALIISGGIAWGIREVLLEGQTVALQVGIATVVLYIANTLLVSTVISLASEEPLLPVWQRCYFWSFPYYLVGGLAAGLMCVTAPLGWVGPFLILPITAMVYISYRAHINAPATVPRASESAA